MEVPVRGLDHVPRWPVPVERVGDLGVAGDRPDLLLPHVVRPAAAVDALASGERREGQERPVDRVGVEPVVGARAHHDHRPALGLLGVPRELAADPGRRRTRDSGDPLLPGRRAGRVRVVVRRGPLAGQALPVGGASDAVLGEQQVEHRRDQSATHPAHRHAPGQVAGGSVGGVEPRHRDQRGLARRVDQGQLRVDALEVEVPAPDPGLAVAMSQRAVGERGLVGAGIDQDRLERRVLLVLVDRQVGGRQELPGLVRSLSVVEPAVSVVEPVETTSSSITRYGRSVYFFT